MAVLSGLCTALLRVMLPLGLLAGGAAMAADPGVPAWPRAGEIVYQVSMGDGPQVGEARHVWSHDTQSYRMETVLRTVGLAALIKKLHYVQRSEGEVRGASLRPVRFSVEREGRVAEQAEFNWAQLQVAHTRKGRTRASAVSAGAQDVLSLWHQIGVAAARPLPARLQVVTGRKTAESTLVWAGEETLDLPLGRLQTRRLTARAADGSMEIDVWFAPSRHMLPVRIRMKDDEGEVLDQRASVLQIGTPAAQTNNGKDG